MTCVACCPFVTVIINQRNSPLVWICSDGRWMMRGSRICGVFAFGVLWVQVFLFFWRNLIIFQIINQFQNRLGLLRDKIQNPNLVSSYGSTELVSYELSTTAVFLSLIQLLDPFIIQSINQIFLTSPSSHVAWFSNQEISRMIMISIETASLSDTFDNDSRFVN